MIYSTRGTKPLRQTTPSLRQRPTTVPNSPRYRRLTLAFTLFACALWATTAHAQEPQELIVYLIDHQFVSDAEMATIQDEIGEIFRAEAGVNIRWVLDDSPRRRLNTNELRFLILASDGTRWFHGPSNVIGHST